MVIGTSHEYTGNQQIEDLSPVLNQFGYQGRAWTYLINDGRPSTNAMTAWEDRDLSAPAINAQTQGVTYSTLETAIATATKRTNFTQILAHVIRITDSALADEVVGGNPMADQTKYKMMLYLNDLEYNGLNATGKSGASAVASQMHGAFSWAFTNGDTGTNTRAWTTTNSGVSADTSFIRTMQLKGNKKGLNISDFILDDTMKARFSQTASTPAPVYRVQDDDTIMQAIDMYKSDFSASRFWLSHYVEFEGGPTGSTRLFGLGTNAHLLLGVDRSQVDRAWYRKTHFVDIAKTASSEGRAIEGELTQRYWAPASIMVNWGVL